MTFLVGTGLPLVLGSRTEELPLTELRTDLSQEFVHRDGELFSLQRVERIQSRPLEAVARVQTRPEEEHNRLNSMLDDQRIETSTDIARELIRVALGE